MANAALGLLLQQEVHVASILCHIGADGLLVDAVDQVKINVVRAEFAELFLKDLLNVGVGHYIELGAQIVAVPGISAQGLTQKGFRFPRVVDIGGVIVVDALLHGVADDRPRLLSVNFPPAHRQAHVAHTQAGELEVLNCL